MSNETKGGAKKEMGQLFVDLGINGLGKTLAGLGAVKFGFNLAKKAGEQLTKPFKELTSDAANFAVNAGKMAKALGTTEIQILQLKQYLKNFNLSESLTGDIGNLRTMFYNLHHGLGGISGEVAGALNQIGMSVFDNDGTFQGTLDFIEKIRERTKDLNDADRNSILQRLGMSEEWGYAWEKGGFNLNDYKTISKEQVEAAQKAQEAMNKLKNKFETLQMTIAADLAPYVKKIANFLSDRVKDPVQFNNDIKKTAQTAKDVAPSIWRSILATAIPYSFLENYYKNYIKDKPTQKDKGFWGELYENHLITRPFIKPKGTPSGGAAGISLGDTSILGDMSKYNPLSQGEMSSILNQTSNTVNITNNQNIQGSNAQEIANKIKEIDLAQAERNQYQLHNNAGR